MWCGHCAGCCAGSWRGKFCCGLAFHLATQNILNRRKAQWKPGPRNFWPTVRKFLQKGRIYLKKKNFLLKGLNCGTACIFKQFSERVVPFHCVDIFPFYSSQKAKLKNRTHVLKKVWVFQDLCGGQSNFSLSKSRNRHVSTQVCFKEHDHVSHWGSQIGAEKRTQTLRGECA